MSNQEREYHLEPLPPNPAGATQCIVKWLVETPSGWLGAWDKEAFDSFKSIIREQCIRELEQTLHQAINELEPTADETSQHSAATSVAAALGESMGLYLDSDQCKMGDVEVSKTNGRSLKRRCHKPKIKGD